MNVNWLKDTQGNSAERLRFFFENYVHHSFKVMKDELYSVRIRISREWLRYVGESIWHDSQQIQKLMDGGDRDQLPGGGAGRDPPVGDGDGAGGSCDQATGVGSGSDPIVIWFFGLDIQSQ